MENFGVRIRDKETQRTALIAARRWRVLTSLIAENAFCRAKNPFSHTDYENLLAKWTVISQCDIFLWVFVIFKLKCRA